MTDAAPLPFEQAIQYFRAKLKLVQSPKWADMLHGEHTNGFTVAGAANDAILTDFYEAVDKAVSQGTTLEDFRKDFDQIVTTHGWSYNGSRNWRSKVIYQTNVSTAYAAGRYAQMTDPDVTRYQPFWRYVHDNSVKHPRKDHEQWDGLVLAHDDPWWNTHYPPNGWGCGCTAEPVSRRELKAMGKSGPDTAPDLKMRTEPLNTSAGKIEIEVPEGIDPGWGYRPGSAATLKIPDETDALAAKQRGPNTNLTAGDWTTAGRPETPPLDPTSTPLWPRISNQDRLQRDLEQMLGGSSGALRLPTGHAVVVRASNLSQHLLSGAQPHPERTPFLALLPELLSDPYEIWANFERMPDGGGIVLRQRIIRAFDLTKRNNLLMVVQAQEGKFIDITFVPMSSYKDINKSRVGSLIYHRP